MSKQVARILFGFFFLAVLLAAAVWLRKEQIIFKCFTHFQNKFESKYNVRLRVDSVKLLSLNKFSLSGLTLQSKTHPVPLLKINSIKIQPSLSGLFTGRVLPRHIYADSIIIQVVSDTFGNNYSWLLKKNASDIIDEGEDLLIAKAKRWEGRLKQISTSDFRLNFLTLFHTKDSITEQILFRRMVIENGLLNATLENASTRAASKISIALDEGKHMIKCDFSGDDEALFSVPLVENLFGLKAAWQRAEFRASWKFSEDKIALETRAAIDNLVLHHWRLSDSDVRFLPIFWQGNVRLSHNEYELDSASTIQMGGLPLQLFANFQFPDSGWMATLKLCFDDVPADTFFQSLPKGMFDAFQGISCGGALAYQLNFSADSRQLDSLVFRSLMTNKNLFLRHFGVENFSRINNDFFHDVYLKDRLVRRIEVASSNPNFFSLRQISRLLTASVLQSEDPSFMKHSGFLETAFRESVIQNIRERRFARGGSTISMQLVKNVFLNRNKTIARKAEEAMIVYLIENLRLVSKERMLEIYLNIIEWGPGVYGIGEASRFYFNKKPSELNLRESIFLAGIIPNPKFFKYHFEKDGTLKPHFRRYFEVLSTRMLQRGAIEPSDTLKLFEALKFNGAAAKFVATEATSLDEEEF